MKSGIVVYVWGVVVLQVLDHRSSRLLAYEFITIYVKPIQESKYIYC